MARSENNLNAVFQDTANAIRSKTGKNGLIIPRDFADEVASIETGIEPSGTLNISENGTYDVTDYAEADVNVESYPEPSGTIELVEQGYADVKDYARADVRLNKISLVYSSFTQPGSFLNAGYKVTIMNMLDFNTNDEGIYAEVSIDCSDMPETDYASYIEGKLDDIGVDCGGRELELVLPIYYFNTGSERNSYIDHMIFRFVNVSWSDSGGEWDSNFINWLTSEFTGMYIYTLSGHSYDVLGWNNEHVEIVISGSSS